MITSGRVSAAVPRSGAVSTQITKPWWAREAPGGLGSHPVAGGQRLLERVRALSPGDLALNWGSALLPAAWHWPCPSATLSLTLPPAARAQYYLPLRVVLKTKRDGST